MAPFGSAIRRAASATLRTASFGFSSREKSTPRDHTESPLRAVAMSRKRPKLCPDTRLPSCSDHKEQTKQIHDSDILDMPRRQVSKVGFSFTPGSRLQPDCERPSNEPSEWTELSKSLDLCSRKKCSPKLRSTLADNTLSAPELRSALAEVERLGCISKKGCERIQREFKELHGGLDFPGVPDCVDC